VATRSARIANWDQTGRGGASYPAGRWHSLSGASA